MAEPDRVQIFDRSIDLIINGDRNLDRWAHRYMTIQGGLAVGVTAILGLKQQTGPAVFIAAALVGGLGITFALAVLSILGRNAAWQRTYMAVARGAQQCKDVVLFDGGLVEREQAAPYTPPRVIGVMTKVTIAIVIVWSLFIVAMICASVR